ncbi:MAG: hypothetical protein KDB73_15040 [Planctomycetes bacterium]|nr:hypothetical protein [Planctomycetota bacterium]
MQMTGLCHDGLELDSGAHVQHAVVDAEHIAIEWDQDGDHWSIQARRTDLRGSYVGLMGCGAPAVDYEYEVDLHRYESEAGSIALIGHWRFAATGESAGILFVLRPIKAASKTGL